MVKSGLVDFRPGERDALEDVILSLKEQRPLRLRLCVVVGLSDEEVISLADAIPIDIQELRLNHCQHSFVAQVVEKLKDTKIRKLTLFGNQINDGLVKAVGELLQKNQGLEEVNLKHNAIESFGACAIAQGLRCHSTLRRVDLSDSLVDNRGKDSLVDAMKYNKSVKVMNLAGKVFRSLPSNESLGEMLCQNSALQELDLCRNYLNPREVIEMADALKTSNRSLTSLRLCSTNLDRNCSVAIGEMLACNPTLKHLDLGGNQKIGFSGAIAIAEGVTYLEHLDLRNTRLGVIGANAISQMLKKNTSLKSLNLSRNNIGDEGCALLIDGLAKNAGLRTLSLSMCSITKKGAIYLGHHLPGMEVIKHIFLYQNPIDEDGSMALLEGLKKNMSLIDFGLEKRCMPSCEELSFYLKLNRVGRRVLREHFIPDALWPTIFARAKSADAIFYLLREKPELCQ
jgi:Ran GTPase-activating protein (RanGAP) involved in mRNA processing and transport